MNNVLDEFKRKGGQVYMDDIVVHARDYDMHDRILEQVIIKFKEFGLKVESNKVQKKLDEVRLLGVLINGRMLDLMK